LIQPVGQFLHPFQVTLSFHQVPGRLIPEFTKDFDPCNFILTC
jgi:hypothetical protein